MKAMTLRRLSPLLSIPLVRSFLKNDPFHGMEQSSHGSYRELALRDVDPAIHALGVEAQERMSRLILKKKR